MCRFSSVDCLDLEKLAREAWLACKRTTQSC
jgi:hypothetical protein